MFQSDKTDSCFSHSVQLKHNKTASVRTTEIYDITIVEWHAEDDMPPQRAHINTENQDACTHIDTRGLHTSTKGRLYSHSVNGDALS